MIPHLITTDAAITAVANLWDKRGPAALPKFRDWPLADIEGRWAECFNRGELISAAVLPRELAAAVAACEYHDELPPVVSWSKMTGLYILKRRTGRKGRKARV